MTQQIRNAPVQDTTSHTGRGTAALLCTAILALMLAAGLPTLVYPRAAQLPADPAILQVQRTDDATVLLPDGSAPAGAGVKEHYPLTVSTYISAGKQSPADPESVVWRIATQISTGPRSDLLNAQVETVSLNRKTTYPTNCCGDALATDLQNPDGIPLEHTGYVTFPFNTQKTSYPLWDIQLKKARTARYLGTDTRNGMLVYKFQAENEWTKIGTRELPGALLELPDPSIQAETWYRDSRVYYVEPQTGATVDVSEDLEQEFRYQDRHITVVSARLESPGLDEATVASLKQGATMLPWLRYRASLLGVLIALGCLVTILVLRVRRRS